MAMLPQGTTQGLCSALELLAFNRGRGRGKGQLRHGIRGDNVDMGVRHFVTGDNNADPLRLKRLLLCLANDARHVEQMAGKLRGGVYPVIDLFDGYDQGVTEGHWVDRQEGNTVLIAPDESAGDIAVDDAASRLQKYTLTGECDGYWHGQPGMEVAASSAAGIDNSRGCA